MPSKKYLILFFVDSTIIIYYNTLYKSVVITTERAFMNIFNQKLFSGIDSNGLKALTDCFNSEIKTFAKDEFVLSAGNKTSQIGVIISGMVLLVNDDFWGNRTIISEIGKGDIFAESYACADNEPMAVSVLAAEKSELLFFSPQKILSSKSIPHDTQMRFIQNLLKILAEKNILLTKKMEHITKRSSREKLLSYLSSQSQKNGSPSFDIPFNRQQMADYLSLDRSAMSNELCRLRDEGLLSFKKNHFVLKQ